MRCGAVSSPSLCTPRQASPDLSCTPPGPATAAASDDGSDSDDDGLRVNIEEGFINTKKAALTALGALCQHTLQHFSPYVTVTLTTLLDKQYTILTSIHDNIRAEGVSILQYYITVMLATKGITPSTLDTQIPRILDAQNPRLPDFRNPKWPKGQIIDLDAESSHLAIQILQSVVTVILSDRDKLPVANAIECLDGILDVLGATTLSLVVNLSGLTDLPSNGSVPPLPTAQPLRMIDVIVHVLHMLFMNSLRCQAEKNGDVSIEDEHSSAIDHDDILFDSVTDLLSKLAVCLPIDTFTALFPPFYTHLLTFLQPHRPPSDRSTAMGCLAEIFKELRTSAIMYFPNFLPEIQRNLVDPLESVRRNTAFALHVVIEVQGSAGGVQGSGEDLTSHHNTFLSWLAPLCQRQGHATRPGLSPTTTTTLLTYENTASSDALGADTDNALSAVCTMLRINAACLPVAAILPVVLDALPLRGDPIEGPNIYTTLTGLLTSQHSVLHTILDINAHPTIAFLNDVNLTKLNWPSPGSGTTVDGSSTASGQVNVCMYIIAACIQALSHTSNATEETRAIVSTGLKAAYASSSVCKVAMEMYVRALNSATLQEQVIAMLQQA